MSAVRPLRSLRGSSLRFNSSIPCSAVRTFHASSAVSQARQAPSKPDAGKPPVNPATAPYTLEQLKELRELYTPEQMAALLAGEAAIDRADFEKRKPRDGWDMWKVPYADDFSEYIPILDFPPPDPHNTPEIEAVDTPFPKLEDDPYVTWSAEEGETEMNFKELEKQTGLNKKEIKNLYVKNLVFHRVMNQTRLGKIQKFYSLTVVGNMDGLLGIGEGKSAEPDDARQVSLIDAIKRMEPIPRYENRTIFGNVAMKNGAVEMELFARPPGFGVRCSPNIYEVMRAVGIEDVSVRVTRSRNPMNVIKTLVYALKRQKLPETIARGRGIKLVDVRKTYYGNAK